MLLLLRPKADYCVRFGRRRRKKRQGEEGRSSLMEEFETRVRFKRFTKEQDTLLVFKNYKYNANSLVALIDAQYLFVAFTLLGILCNISNSSQQLIIKSSSQNDNYHRQQYENQERSIFSPTNHYEQAHKLNTLRNQFTSSSTTNQVPSSSRSPVSRRSHQSQIINTANTSPIEQDREARSSQIIPRNLYHGGSNYRGARNSSSISLSSSSSSSSNPLGSWHFPRISPEQAAEVLLTGAQVINRIAQAETPLNYCKTPDNQEGECSDIRKCIWLVLDKARLKQSVCLRNLIIPAVCCPLSNANNTPMANMIQSTLEPVLFRPKQPKQKKHPAQMKPFASIVNKTVLGSPPPSPASLIIRNPNLLPSTASSSSSSSQPTTTSLSSYSSTSPTTTLVSSGSPDLIPVNSAADFVSATQSSGNLMIQSSEPTRLSTSPQTASQQQFSLFQDAVKGESTMYHPPPKTNADYNRTLSLKYPWANETCGEGSRTRTGRIVGGSDSKLGQWPWMTAMYLNKRNTFTGSSSNSGGEFWCGGALINKRFILTAAHCLSDQRGNRYKNEQVTIKLGGVDLVRHQAPVDILKNVELESRSNNGILVANSLRRSSNQLTFSRQHNNDHNGTTSVRSSGDDEEEFSWTSFITKALGLGGGSSSSSSGNNGNSNSNNNQFANSPTSSAESSTKSINTADKKQQLAAHAKRTYFKEYRVANIKQHPKFQRHGFYNDIGLIELKSDVEYDDLISPVCLPSEYDMKRDLSGYMATVLGWGTLSYGGQGSKLLQQVSMPIWNNKDCDDRYLQHIGKTFVCAGFLTGGKDACQGDSGGPLMVSDKSGRWTLHGVVSFGKTCAQAGYPGVYTRVTEYLDWIRDNTDLNGYSMATHNPPSILAT